MGGLRTNPIDQPAQRGLTDGVLPYVPTFHVRAVPQTAWTIGKCLTEAKPPLATTDLIGRTDGLADTGESWVSGALIIGAISFNAVLCFLNSRGVAISDFHVKISEAVLISAALVAIRNHMNITSVTILTIILTYTISLSALRFANEGGFIEK